MAAGFKYYQAYISDCACRAITIASGLPYKDVWNRLADGNVSQRNSEVLRERSADRGIDTHSEWCRAYMKELGFTWVDKRDAMINIMNCDDEIPAGRLVVECGPDSYRVNMHEMIMAVAAHKTRPQQYYDFISAYAKGHCVAVINHVMHDLSFPMVSDERCRVLGYWQLNK